MNCPLKNKTTRCEGIQGAKGVDQGKLHGRGVARNLPELTKAIKLYVQKDKANKKKPMLDRSH